MTCASGSSAYAACSCRPSSGVALIATLTGDVYLALTLPAPAHLDLPRLRLGRLGHVDLEYAVTVLGPDVLGVDILRQGDPALELTVLALAALVLLALPGLLAVLAMPVDGEHVVLDLDLDVVLPDARQVALEDQLVAALPQVDRRVIALLPSSVQRADQPAEVGHLGEGIPRVIGHVVASCLGFAYPFNLPADRAMRRTTVRRVKETP